MALTDPAKELAETLNLLAAEPNMAVADRIASSARVDIWTPDFFRVFFELMSRIDLVSSKIKDLPMDEDIREDALRSVADIKSVFSNSQILSQSNGDIRKRLTGSNATVLKMLSMMIREKISYPLLDRETRTEVLRDCSELRNWLVEVQSDEKDFVRQALIEGLESFIFRLERLEWLGHGFVLDGLKSVIHAYLSVQGARSIDDGGAELQDAILAKAKSVIVRALTAFDLVKDNAERADWALRAYGAVSALADGSATVTALLN
jgi:hypothetical protein